MFCASGHEGTIAMKAALRTGNKLEKRILVFFPDILPSLKSSWIYCKMQRASRYLAQILQQMPAETTFLFTLDDKFFISSHDFL